MYTYRFSKLAKTKLIHVSFKCEALLYPWLLIKFIYANVFYTNFGPYLEDRIVWKYSRWVPHELSQKNLDDRVIICTSLLAWNKIESILNRMITGDEKWITYENIIRKRAYCKPRKPSPSTSKPNLTLNKRMLCIWWDI